MKRKRLMRHCDDRSAVTLAQVSRLIIRSQAAVDAARYSAFGALPWDVDAAFGAVPPLTLSRFRRVVEARMLPSCRSLHLGPSVRMIPFV
jgi:hypothetical protein